MSVNGITLFKLTSQFFPQGVTNEDEFLAVANSDISQLCGEIIVLWNAFKSMFVGSSRSSERRSVVQHLARVHHIQRVRRELRGSFLNFDPSIHLKWKREGNGPIPRHATIKAMNNEP